MHNDHEGMMSLKYPQVGYISLEAQVIIKYNNYKVQNMFFTLNHVSVDDSVNIALDIVNVNWM